MLFREMHNYASSRVKSEIVLPRKKEKHNMCFHKKHSCASSKRENTVVLPLEKTQFVLPREVHMCLCFPGKKEEAWLCFPKKEKHVLPEKSEKKAQPYFRIFFCYFFWVLVFFQFYFLFLIPVFLFFIEKIFVETFF